MKLKKLLALTCAATMLVPTVAFATEGTGNYTGDIVIENDNSDLPLISVVNLPTINADTYDFIIDTAGILNTVDPGNYTGQTVYFVKENTAAALDVDGTTYDTLYEIDYQEDTSLTKLKTILPVDGTTTLADVATSLAAANFYVWTPEVDGDIKTGNGEFAVQITADNIANYFDIVTVSDTDLKVTAITAKPHQVGSYIWDGKLYYQDYATISSTDAAVKYYTVTNDTASLASGLYVGLASAVAGGTAPEAAVLGTNVTYTAATYTNTNTSDIAKIVNKSTFSIAITATATLNNSTGLTIDDKTTNSDFNATTTDTSFYLAIQDAATTSNIAPIAAGNTSVSAYYVLDGVTATTTYQGLDTDIDDKTGSHNYYQYLNPNPTYGEASFAITADADADDTGWDAYIAGLQAGSNTKPTIDVVYSWEKVALYDTDTDQILDAYVGETTRTETDSVTGNTYKVTAPGWVDAATKYVAGSTTPLSGTAPTVSTPAYTIASDADYTITYTLNGTNDYAATEIKDVYFYVDEWDKGFSAYGFNGGSTENTPITITNSDITISKDVVMGWLTAGNSYDLTIEYYDSASGTTFTQTYTIAVN